jgi:hypothetical protein
VTTSHYPNYHFSGGHDWLEWGAHVQWEESHFQSLTKKLESAKAYCQENKLPIHEININGVGGIMVSRMGGNRGGDHGEHYEYKISWGRITLGIACRSEAKGKRPNVYAQLKGRECLLLGALEGYGLARDLIALLGGKIVEEKLSRVDLSLDIAGLSTRELQEAIEQQRFITDANEVRPVVEILHDSKTGFTAGKRPMRLVVYDKLQELQSKSDCLYIQGMIDRRWNGNKPSAATRIEFQCCRSWLVDQGISSPADLFRLQGSLVEKLTGQWFRMTESNVDRENKNQSWAETSKIWQAIQSAFRQIYGQPAGPLLPIRRDKIDPIRIIKQGRGCLRNALLQMHCECRTYAQFIREAARLLEHAGTATQDSVKFMDEYQRMELEYMT